MRGSEMVQATKRQQSGFSSPAERAARRDLAAAYRLVALYGWDDHVATHMSARLPDGTYLINPFGVMFEEITASSLLRIGADDQPVDDAEAALNPAGINIH